MLLAEFGPRKRGNRHSIALPDSAIKAMGAKGSESEKEFLDPALDKTTGAGKNK